MKISIADYEDYLFDHYKSHGIDISLFMKLQNLQKNFVTDISESEQTDLLFLIQVAMKPISVGFSTILTAQLLKCAETA